MIRFILRDANGTLVEVPWSSAGFLGRVMNPEAPTPPGPISPHPYDLPVAVRELLWGTESRSSRIRESFDRVLLRVPSYRRARLFTLFDHPSVQAIVSCVCDLEASAVGKLSWVRNSQPDIGSADGPVPELERLLLKSTSQKSRSYLRHPTIPASKARLGILVVRGIASESSEPNSDLERAIEIAVERELREFLVKDQLLKLLIPDYDPEKVLGQQQSGPFLRAFASLFGNHLFPRYAAFTRYSRTAMATMLIAAYDADEQNVEIFVKEDFDPARIAEVAAALRLNEFVRHPRPFLTSRNGQVVYDYGLEEDVLAGRYTPQFMVAENLFLASTALYLAYILALWPDLSFLPTLSVVAFIMFELLYGAVLLFRRVGSAPFSLKRLSLWRWALLLYPSSKTSDHKSAFSH